jgi:steroid delta-isomerase-like uncharacterized protein
MTTTQTAEPKTSQVGDETSDDEEIVRRLFEEIFNQGHLELANELVATEFVDHVPSPVPIPCEGPAAIRWMAGEFRKAFPDLHVTIQDVIANGDKVVTRVTWTGTQTGQILGALPTGKSMKASGIDIIRLKQGKVVEHWGQMDVLAVITQLGFLTFP